MQRIVSLAFLSALGGCYSGLSTDIDDGGAADGTAGSDDTRDDVDPDPEQACAGVGAAVAPLRRMTRSQYENTIRDLFSGRLAPSESFPESETFEGYSNDLDSAIVSLRTAEDILIAAEDLAEQIVGDPAIVTDCAAGADVSCIDGFVRDFGARAYRRPLHDDEAALLQTAFEAGSEDGFADGIATVVEVALQSPQFLYFVESGKSLAPGVVELTDYELASRLSYLLWDTMPDAALFEAAAAGGLRDPDILESQVRRLLADEERSGPALERFVREWLHVDGVETFDKEASEFPEFDDDLVAAIDSEFSRFVRGVMFGDTPTIEALLTSRSTEIDASLAALYGMDAPVEDWQSVELDANRAGLLTRAAFLAEHSTASASGPLFRGRLIRTQLLCQTIPPPPPDAMANAPEYPPDATERERSAILIAQPACGGCHQLMDPLGLGFEAYDAIGAFRPLDAEGNPIDVSGDIIASPGGDDLRFDGVPELTALLSESDAVSQCVSRQFFQHALGLNGTEVQACASDPIEAAFVDSGGDLHEMIVAFARSPGFWLRLDEEEA